MKNLITAVAVSALSIAAFAQATPAHAAGSAAQISMCADALQSEGLAPADAFRTEFVSIKGASLRTVTMKLIPLAGGIEQFAECQIKRGKVVGAEIKA